MPPYVVVEGAGSAVAVAVAQVRDAGWVVRPGWATDGAAGVVQSGVVQSGVVDDGPTAAAALLAALAGAGVVVHGRAGRDVLDRLCEDLRRLGRVDHRLPGDRSWPALEPEERELLELLACPSAPPRSPCTCPGGPPTAGWPRSAAGSA